MSVHVAFRAEGDTHVRCCTYPEDPPILMLDHSGVCLSPYTGTLHGIDAEELGFVREFAATVQKFRIECERVHAAAKATHPAADCGDHSTANAAERT